MKICTNKKSEKAFVYLGEEENGRVLLVTPLGEVKALERALFSEPFDVEDEKGLLEAGQITVEQYDCHRKFVEG